MILSLYRALSVDFNQFLRVLHATLKFLHNPKSELLFCGIVNKLSQWKHIKQTKFHNNNL
jgi:hypothetical protein